MNISISSARSLVLQYKVYFNSSFIYLLSSLFTAVIGLAINPFMARNLSPGDYAIIGYFTSFNLIVLPILNFSLISYYLRNYYKIPDDRKQLVSDTILLALLFYGFVALLICCMAFYFYCQLSRVSFTYYPYAILAFAPVFMNNFLVLYQVNCRLKREANKYGKVTVFSSMLSAILALLLVVFYKYGATGRLMATLLASAVTAIYCFKQLFGKLQFDFRVIKEAFKFGWPLSLSAMLWYFLSGIDRAMLEKLNDSHTFGYYNVGMQIAGYLMIFYTAIQQTFEPDIYKAIAENKKRKLIKIILGVISLSSIPNFIFIIFSSVIIGVLTSNRYTDASSFAQIFAIKNIAVAIYYSINAVIVGYGYTCHQLALLIIGSITSIIEYKILIHYFEFYGAAWGQVISMVMMSMMSMIAIIFLVYKYKGSIYAHHQ